MRSTDHETVVRSHTETRTLVFVFLTACRGKCKARLSLPGVICAGGFRGLREEEWEWIMWLGRYVHIARVGELQTALKASSWLFYSFRVWSVFCWTGHYEWSQLSKTFYSVISCNWALSDVFYAICTVFKRVFYFILQYFSNFYIILQRFVTFLSAKRSL